MSADKTVHGSVNALRGQQSSSVGRFEYYTNGIHWRWRLKAANGEIIAHGEGYSSKQLVLDAIDRVIDYSSTVAETRPDKLVKKSNPKRGEILTGNGTQIIEVDR